MNQTIGPLPIALAVSAMGVCFLPCFGAAADSAPGPATGKIMTVTGPIEPGTLGPTLTHEHIFIDATVREDTPQGWAAAGLERPSMPAAQALYAAPLTMNVLNAVTLGAPNRDNQVLSDEKVAIEEVKQLKRYGGTAMVDLTSIGLHRDPPALRRVAEATGVDIVMGSSWFNAQWAGDNFTGRSMESLTDEIVRDINVGVDDTGIRAGIIGEVLATDPDDANQRKILQASARASRMTGAAISIFAGPGTQLKALEVLTAAGADPSRVVVGRAVSSANDLPTLEKIIARGAYIDFDSLGDAPTVNTEVDDHDVAMVVIELIKRGHTERILLSHDVHQKTDLQAYGGNGYSFIGQFFGPYLKKLGVTDAQLQTILVDNPRRLLTLATPRK